MDLIFIIFLKSLFIDFVLPANSPNVPPSQPGDDSPAEKEYVRVALSDPSKRRILDPEWSKTVEEWVNLSKRKFDPPVRQDKAFNAERVSWTITGSGEVPYAAIIYDDRKESKKGEPRFSLDIGRACGAVLLTQRKYMTSCACIYEWKNVRLQHKTGQKDPTYKPYHNKYGIGVDYSDKNNILSYDIWLSISQVFFDPLEELKLVEDGTWDNSECYGAVNLERSTPGEEYAVLHAFAILEFGGSLDLLDYPKDIYLTWPPKILFEELGEDFGRAEVVGFGFKKRPDVRKDFYDDFGHVLNISEISVTLDLNNTCDSSKIHGVDRWKWGWWYPPEVICAYVTKIWTYQLCGGLVGSVAIRDGIAYGMVTIPMDCSDGQVIIRPFYKPSYWLIQSNVSREVLIGENDKEPVLRLPSRFVSYDIESPEDIKYRKQTHSNQGSFSISKLLLLLNIFFISVN